MNSVENPIQVLHVDDDPDFADLTADFVEREDERITVETAASANEGLSQLSEENFDCVVSDYDMPKKNGIEFLETVREDFSDLPFILFTGKGSEEIASEAISAGVTDYIQKEGGTGQYSILANRVINAVNRRRTKQDLRASEQRYRQLLGAAPVPILLYSENLEVIHANEAAVEFLNADKREELIGRHATEFAHPENEDRVQSRLQQVVSNRESMPAVEVKITALDGSEKFAIASSTPGMYDGEPVVQTVAYDITEQKQQAENYEAIFENTPEGIVLHDAEDGSFVDMNTRYVEMFGYDSKDEFLDAGFEAIHPNEPPYTLERAAEQVETAITEGTHSFEWPGVRKDGSRFWAEVHLAPIELHGEQRILAAVRDISERKNREEELRQTSRRLKLALDATDTGVWEWNMETDEVSWSESLERLLGFEPGTFGGTYEAHEDYLHPDDIQTVEQAAEEALQGDGSFEAEFRMIREDGETIWVRGSGEHFTEDGPERMIGTTTDITERKEREQDLEEARELTDALSTTFPDYTFIYNEDGEYLDVITGWEGSPNLYSPEELVGRNVEELLSDETAGKIQSAIQRALDTGELQTIEYTIEPPDQTLWYEANLAPLEARYAGERAVVLTARDITERKLRERELQRQNERLEEFAALVSHDLRNPLTVAEGHLQLAIENRDWEELDGVAGALDRMETLIDDMLSLANAGEDVGELEAVELADLADACWRNVETETATFNADTSATIRADRTRLQQLVENLLRNAVEHGGADVTITIGDLDDGFYVEDDGPGIPADERDDVLDPGYSTREAGTGFGLSIVRDIAEAHDWQIEVTEGSDGGARFEFTGLKTSTE